MEKTTGTTGTASAASAANSTAKDDALAPIVIDLGKAKRKKLKELKRGRGELLIRIDEIAREVQLNMGEDTTKKVLPVVVIYREKEKRTRNAGGIFGC